MTLVDFMNKGLDVFKLENIYNLELAKFMQKLYNNKLFYFKLTKFELFICYKLGKLQGLRHGFFKIFLEKFFKLNVN